jgi:outer membrane lipoprotein carrier protein
MMKNVFVPVFCLMMLNMSSVTQAQQDPEQQAEEVLDALALQYGQYDVIKAEFRYIIESRDEQDDFREEQKGTVWLQGRKFRLDLGAQEIICDDKTIWTHIKDAREVQVNHFNDAEFEFHPSEIFTVYKEDYRYIYVGKQVSGGEVFDVIELNPLDRNDMIFKVRLYVNQNTGLIETSKVFEKTGMVYTYEILSFEPNPSIENNFFSFRKDQYPDVKVIDLR